jgi:glycosyltransferase involved in cell wall biosynthesis
MKKIKIAYLISHPIQYQVPMIKFISKDPSIALKVFYSSNISVSEYYDQGFGKKIEWDVSLLDGYNYEFLPTLTDPKQLSFIKPVNFGLFKKLKEGNFDILWTHGYGRFLYWEAFVFAKILGIKTLVRDEAWEKSTNRSSFNKAYKKIWFRLLNRLVDGFLYIGQKNKEYYLSNRISPKKLYLSPYTVDNEFFQSKTKSASPDKLRKELGLEENRPILLYASKLTARKRVIDLYKAFKSILKHKNLPRPYLIIVGDGEMMHDLSMRVKQDNLKTNVRLLGFKNQSDLPNYYSLCDAFILPSYNEAWGLVINEAMNSGKAIIASDQVGSAFNLIENNKNGFIFEAGNIKELSNSIIETIKSPQKCKKMGEESLERIKNWNFSKNLEALKNFIGQNFNES